MSKERERVVSNDRQAARIRGAGNQKKIDGNVAAQRLLIAYISEDPGIYEVIKDYISPSDFCDEICKKTIDILCEQLKNGRVDPAGIIAQFPEPEECGIVSGIFYEELKGASKDKGEKEKIIKDLLVKVRSAGYQRDVSLMGSDPEALNRIIKGKKDIEQLKKMEIRISDGE